MVIREIAWSQPAIDSHRRADGTRVGVTRVRGNSAITPPLITGASKPAMRVLIMLRGSSARRSR